MKNQLLKSRISKFIVVGTIGFIVDATILKLCIEYGNTDPIMARIISFPCAVTITWLLNRRYTYKANTLLTKIQLLREWGQYITVNSFGATINIGVYALIIHFVLAASLYPVFTLGAASLTAIFFNYLGTTYLVFNNKQ